MRDLEEEGGRHEGNAQKGEQEGEDAQNSSGRVMRHIFFFFKRGMKQTPSTEKSSCFFFFPPQAGARAIKCPPPT